MDKIKFGPYTVELSHTGKVFFPGSKITKGDIIKYYHKVADTMLPHIKDRPVTMHRFPDGIKGEEFYQKDTPDYFPEWIERASIKRKEGGSIEMVICNKMATLVYLADQAAITLHVWLSRRDKLNYPDKMVFDLDPPDSDFEPVRSAALSLKNMVEEVGLVPFLMTSGSRGLHVVVPLNRSADFDTVRSFAQDLAEILAGRDPENLTTEIRKDKRGGRLFLDTQRNAYAQTSVAPYSVRAKEGAPVATPLEWSELKNKNLHSRSYNTRNIFQRLEKKGDPWKGMMRNSRSLKKPRKNLKKLL